MTKLYFPALFALLLLPLVLPPVETVTFPSGEITLYGVLYKPQGTGPFPAVIYNHGSAPGMMSQQAFAALGPPPGFEILLPAVIERTRATFKMMLQTGVPLLFGSDTPAGDGFGNPPGLNGRLEMQDWIEAGAPLPLVLRAATLDNAIALGLSHELGSIEAGKRADLLLLAQNPLTNVSAYDSIEIIFLDGEPIVRETLRGHN
jgi:imidazolonepropionase-like amidohydrolase